MELGLIFMANMYDDSIEQLRKLYEGTAFEQLSQPQEKQEEEVVVEEPVKKDTVLDTLKKFKEIQDSKKVEPVVDEPKEKITPTESMTENQEEEPIETYPDDEVEKTEEPKVIEERQISDPRLEEALAERDKRSRYAAFIEAMAGIGASPSTAVGGRFNAKSDYLRGRAQDPIEKYKRLMQIQKERQKKSEETAEKDRQLKVAEAFRSKLKEQGVEGLSPEMNTQEMLQYKKSFEEATGQKIIGQKNLVNKQTGQPELHFVMQDGSIVPTGRTPAYAPAIQVNPKTQEPEFVQKTGGTSPTPVFEKSEPKKDETKTDKDKPVIADPRDVYNSLNKAERNVVADTKKTFDNLTKESQLAISKVDSIAKKATDATTNPIAAAQLGAETAGIFENGRLTDEDVKRYTRRRGILDKFTDALRTAQSGTITPEKAELIQETLTNYMKYKRQEMNRVAADASKNIYNKVRSELSYDPEDYTPLIYPAYSRKIKVKDTESGKVGTIPAENLDKVIEAKKENGEPRFMIVD